MRKPTIWFRSGPTQTGLYSHRKWLEAGNFGLRKKRIFSIRVLKTKALISWSAPLSSPMQIVDFPMRRLNYDDKMSFDLFYSNLRHVVELTYFVSQK